MKLLITGGLGFIGTNLIESLPKSYGKVVVWDKKNAHDIFDLDFEEQVKKCDIVIHLAALTSVEQSFKEPGKVFMTNVLGTARVAYLCAKYKKKLIYPSSAAIYHRELSPYAESKALAEDIVKGIMNETSVVILRLFNVFGPGMNPNSGSIMYNFLHDKKLVIFGDGEQTRDFIHVQDVVNIIQAAFDKKWNGKIVDCATGKAYTMNYVAGLFAYYRKMEIFYKPPRREIKWSIANTQMLGSLYKKKLTTDLEENIKKLCEQV